MQFELHLNGVTRFGFLGCFEHFQGDFFGHLKILQHSAQHGFFTQFQSVASCAIGFLIQYQIHLFALQLHFIIPEVVLAFAVLSGGEFVGFLAGIKMVEGRIAVGVVKKHRERIYFGLQRADPGLIVELFAQGWQKQEQTYPCQDDERR